MPSWRLEDRVAFEKTCNIYQDCLAKERDKSSLPFEPKPNGVISDARNSSSTPNITSSIPTPHRSSSVITRSYSSPEATLQNSSDDGTTPSDPAIRPSTQSSPSVIHRIPVLPPSQKLSRSMSVFLAWKASL